jgi:hypothetical protein
MPVLTATTAHRLDDESATLSIREIAGYLQKALGQRMTAAIAGLGDARQVGRYLKDGGPQPHPAVERRLREGYKVVRMLVDAYDEGTARAWLFGTNTRLDDEAPIEVLGGATDSKDFTAVLRAARQVASFQASVQEPTSRGDASTHLADQP